MALVDQQTFGFAVELKCAAVRIVDVEPLASSIMKETDHFAYHPNLDDRIDHEDWEDEQ